MNSQTELLAQNSILHLKKAKWIISASRSGKGDRNFISRKGSGVKARGSAGVFPLVSRRRQDIYQQVNHKAKLLERNIPSRLLVDFTNVSEIFWIHFMYPLVKQLVGKNQLKADFKNMPL